MRKKSSPPNPLVELRWALSQDPEQPISQQRLSRIIDVGLDQIRSIESRRRGFSKGIQDQILFECGAVWQEESSRWIFQYDSKKPAYKHIHFDLYRQLLERPPQETDIEVIKLMLQRLFKAVPRPRYHQLLARIHRSFEDWQAKLGLPGDLFSKMWPVLIVQTDIHTGELVDVQRAYLPEITKLLEKEGS
jgi:hypothetical protein